MYLLIPKIGRTCWTPFAYKPLPFPLLAPPSPSPPINLLMKTKYIWLEALLDISPNSLLGDIITNNY